jgi:drug/metabolite transporter (DMT)-like permease
MLGFFRIQDHKFVWIFWGHGSQLPGLIFVVVAVFFWLFYLRVVRLQEPMDTHTPFLWVAVFYTLLPFLFTIQDHKIVLMLLGEDPTVGVIFFAVAFFSWIGYFYRKWKARDTEPAGKFTGWS